jgi:Prp8 binding protein
MFDVESGERIKKYKGHLGIINSCSVSRRGTELLASGSDDTHVKLWDPRQKTAIKSLSAQYPVLSVCFNLDGGLLFSSGIDNLIKVRAFYFFFCKKIDL